MDTNKIIKIVIGVIVIVLIIFYSYYNYLSYNIYKDISQYESSKNSVAVKLSKNIIKEKYPYSIYYFLIK